MFDSHSKGKKGAGAGWGVRLEYWSQILALGTSPDPWRLSSPPPPFVIASSVASSSKPSERLRVAFLGKRAGARVGFEPEDRKTFTSSVTLP